MAVVAALRSVRVTLYNTNIIIHSPPPFVIELASWHV